MGQRSGRALTNRAQKPGEAMCLSLLFLCSAQLVRNIEFSNGRPAKTEHFQCDLLGQQSRVFSGAQCISQSFLTDIRRDFKDSLKFSIVAQFEKL